MMKVIERMNTGIEMATQRKSGSSKDGKKKWPFSRKSTGMSKEETAPGEDEQLEPMRVDLYLVVFLKFIASIVPTIEVDSTAAL